MIIIEECNKNINNFYKKLKDTHNNLYLCETKEILDNVSKINNNNLSINYNLDNKIVNNKLVKISKIIQKIEESNNPIINYRYYEMYNKENKKRIKCIEKQYIKINKYIKKVFKKPTKTKMHLSSLNRKRMLNYKKLI